MTRTRCGFLILCRRSVQVIVWMWLSILCLTILLRLLILSASSNNNLACSRNFLMVRA
jgi:hypothetical protein